MIYEIMMVIFAIVLVTVVFFASKSSCRNSIKNKECAECDKFDEQGRMIKSGIGIPYWVCQEHFPENIRPFSLFRRKKRNDN